MLEPQNDRGLLVSTSIGILHKHDHPCLNFHDMQDDNSMGLYWLVSSRPSDDVMRYYEDEPPPDMWEGIIEVAPFGFDSRFYDGFIVGPPYERAPSEAVFSRWTRLLYRSMMREYIKWAEEEEKIVTPGELTLGDELGIFNLYTKSIHMSGPWQAVDRVLGGNFWYED